MAEIDSARPFRSYTEIVEVYANMPLWQRAVRVGTAALALAGLVGCSNANNSGSSTRTVPTATSAPALSPTPSPTPVCIIPQNTSGTSEVQQFPAHAFSNFQNASGAECAIPADEHIPVECMIIDNNSPIESARIYGGTGPAIWYRFKAVVNGVLRQMHSASNTAWNQKNADYPDLMRPFDRNVPICADSPSRTKPPYHSPTISSTEGSGDNTISFFLPDDGSDYSVLEKGA
jgi:hypothetical protein